MSTTILHEDRPTITAAGAVGSRCPDELLAKYTEILGAGRLNWTEYHTLSKRLGAGGQGVVFLTTRRGSEQNFVEQRLIRMMEMEWIDGYDLSRLLAPELLQRTRASVSDDRWRYLNKVVVTAGPQQSRLKPGVAIAIVRECLAALAALHREGIVHADVKTANIMVKRTGNAKIIDIGSAHPVDDPPPTKTCTPAYAAPEVLEGQTNTPRSDLASLGYVLVEMLSGQPPFAGLQSFSDLLEAKRSLVHRLPQVLPSEVTCNELLMDFCRGLIAADPAKRFPSAEDADMKKGGAASFHRQLIVGGLASEYENEIRAWLEELD